MYISPPVDMAPLRVPALVNGTLLVLVLGQFVVGIYPEWLIQLSRAASSVLAS
jgi:hypothetical protein